MDLAMYTEVNFCNLSQTYIKPEITLFQKTQENNTEKLYAWKVIKNCGHLWNHPFRIDWGYSYQFFDRHGNYSPIVALEKQSYQLSQYYEIGINFSSAQSSQVNFYKKVNNKIIGVNLLKNNRVIARKEIGNGQPLSFTRSGNHYSRVYDETLEIRPSISVHKA